MSQRRRKIMGSLVDWEPDYDYETLKTNMKTMTVADAIELNNKAKLTCGWEITTESEEN